MTGGESSELEDLAQARAGDRGALDRLFKRHVDALYAYSLSLLGKQHDAAAADLTSDAMGQAYRGFSGFRGDCKFKTWLFQIARNHWQSESKRKKARDERRLSDVVEEKIPAAPQSLGGQDTEVSDDVGKAVDSLPPDQCKAIRLYYLSGQTIDEVAAALGKSTGAAKLDLFRAKRSLSELLSNRRS